MEVKAFKSRELIPQWPQGGPVSPLIIGLKTALHMILREWTFFLQSCMYMHLNFFRKITFYANITFSVSVFLKRLAIFLFASWNYQYTLPALGNTPVFPEREMVAEWLGHISHSKCVDDVTLAAGCLLQVIAPTPFATFHLFIYRNKDQQLFLENIFCNWNQYCLVGRTVCSWRCCTELWGLFPIVQHSTFWTYAKRKKAKTDTRLNKRRHLIKNMLKRSIKQFRFCNNDSNKFV